jgi:hypothetical protein
MFAGLAGETVFEYGLERLGLTGAAFEVETDRNSQ